jgi:hypothetical protein
MTEVSMVLSEIYTRCIPLGQINGSIFCFARGFKLEGVTILHDKGSALVKMKNMNRKGAYEEASSSFQVREQKPPCLHYHQALLFGCL